MQITPKTRLICLIVALVFSFGALIGTGTYLIINHLNKSKALLDATSRDHIGNLLSSGTFVNYSVYKQLTDKLYTDTSYHNQSSINGGKPIVFQMGTVNGNPVEWQVVAQYGDIVTVWMTAPYTYSAHSLNSLQKYQDSQLRLSVQQIYATQSGDIFILDQITVSPNDTIKMHADYINHQKTDGNYGGNGVSGHNTLENVDDKFWVPSNYEVFNYWGLGNDDRAYNNGSSAGMYDQTTSLDGTEGNNACWLRTGVNSMYYMYAMLILQDGTYTHSNFGIEFAVRPACHISLSALAEIIEQSTPITLTENIYTTDGNINPDAVNTLLETVQYFGHENDTNTYTAHQIASRNNTVGYNSDSTIIFPLGYVNGTSGESIYWRATYLHNNYLTIWMDKAYTNSTWNSSGGTVSYNSYANSTIQNYLDNTLWSALTMGSGTLQSIFALPTTVGYQDEGDENLSNNNSDTSYWVNSSRTSTFDNLASSVYNGSYLWIPSFGEVFNNTLSEYDENDTTIYTGQWGLNNTDRSFNTNNYDGTTATYDYCWLRSGRTGPGSDNYAMQVHFSGVSTNGPIDGSRGVRPAAHLDLDALYRSTLPAITITTNNAEYGQVFADGQIGESVTVNVAAGEQTPNLIAIPNAGYAFLYWENASTHEIFSELNPLSFEVTSDTTLTAIFGKSVDGVVVTASAGGEVRLVGFDNTATQDTDTITLIAVAYTGYTFSGWYIDGELINADYGASARISYSLIKDKIVTAIFTPSTNQGDMNSQIDNNYTDDFV